jgi:Tol biopolymer transport system component
MEERDVAEARLRLDVASGQTTQLATGLMTGLFGNDGVDVREFPPPSFSPDGRTVLFTSQGFFLETVRSPAARAHDCGATRRGDRIHPTVRR